MIPITNRMTKLPSAKKAKSILLRTPFGGGNRIPHWMLDWQQVILSNEIRAA